MLVTTTTEQLVGVNITRYVDYVLIVVVDLFVLMPSLMCMVPDKGGNQ